MTDSVKGARSEQAGRQHGESLDKELTTPRRESPKRVVTGGVCPPSSHQSAVSAPGNLALTRQSKKQLKGQTTTSKASDQVCAARGTAVTPRPVTAKEPFKRKPRETVASIQELLQKTSDHGLSSVTLDWSNLVKQRASSAEWLTTHGHGLRVNDLALADLHTLPAAAAKRYQAVLDQVCTLYKKRMSRLQGKSFQSLGMLAEPTVAVIFDRSCPHMPLLRAALQEALGSQLRLLDKALLFGVYRAQVHIDLVHFFVGTQTNL